MANTKRLREWRIGIKKEKIEERKVLSGNNLHGCSKTHMKKSYNKKSLENIFFSLVL